MDTTDSGRFRRIDSWCDRLRQIRTATECAHIYACLIVTKTIVLCMHICTERSCTHACAQIWYTCIARLACAHMLFVATYACLHCMCTYISVHIYVFSVCIHVLHCTLYLFSFYINSFRIIYFCDILALSWHGNLRIRSARM